MTNRSSVFAAELDLRKAFDRVCHNKLFEPLREAGIPYYFISIFSNWYSKLSAVVRWNNASSKCICVKSGVRQGSVLSPALFTVFINALIVNRQHADIGCHVHDYFVGCLIYADDIIILSPSIQGLQRMLDICPSSCQLLGLSFNCDKSHCISSRNLYKSRAWPCEAWI